MGKQGDLKRLLTYCYDAMTAYAHIKYGETIGSKVGNMAAMVMGSFKLTWTKTGVDHNGNAIVVCHMSDPMQAKSL